MTDDQLKKDIEEQGVLCSGTIRIHSKPPCYSPETAKLIAETLHKSNLPVIFLKNGPNPRKMQSLINHIPTDDICGVVKTAQYIEKNNIINITYCRSVKDKLIIDTNMHHDMLTLSKRKDDNEMEQVLVMGPLCVMIWKK